MTRLAVCVALFCTTGLTTGCLEAEDQPVTWSYVYATVIQPNCTSSNCHSELASTRGLQFHFKEGAYLMLTGRMCGAEDVPGQPDHNFVVPYEPGRSKVMYMLRGEETLQMPPDVPLPDVEIGFVERWIAQGAACD